MLKKSEGESKGQNSHSIKLGLGFRVPASASSVMIQKKNPFIGLEDGCEQKQGYFRHYLNYSLPKNSMSFFFVYNV